MEKEKAHETFLKFLKNGYRITPQRFEVLDAALDYGTHFKPDELFIKMKNEGSKVSRATVYNTLELLVQCKLLSKRVFDQKITMYESNVNRKQHDHIICEETGEIHEFVEPEVEKLVEKISKKYGITPTGYTFNIFAKCKKK
jgi:Fur family ferric uptake transcriptional regulator